MDLANINHEKIPDAEFITNDDARAQFLLAYDAHTSGDIENALYLYDKSISIVPTAQAYTFKAWAISALQDFEDAIRLCKMAIELDAQYGNPYNDIGVYLMQMGQETEAISWFKKAMVAKKYHCRFFPYYNLGKVYKNNHMLKKAMSCFEKACALEPEFAPSQEELLELQNQLN